jgi:hypothetical protein
MSATEKCQQPNETKPTSSNPTVWAHYIILKTVQKDRGSEVIIIKCQLKSKSPQKMPQKSCDKTTQGGSDRNVKLIVPKVLPRS